MFNPRQSRVAFLSLLFVAACGKPMDPSGKEDPLFTKASMGGMPASEGSDRPLAADLAVEPVSMLVMFNRLQTPDKLQEALNKKPGQFSHLDLDKDNNPDPLTVAPKSAPDGHAFEIRAKPSTGEYVVATMVFDPEWNFMGHYSGAMGGAASTYGRPLAAATTTPSPTPTAPAPVANASAGGAGGVAAPPPSTSAPAAAVTPTATTPAAVVAVPAGSGQEAGVQANP